MTEISTNRIPRHLDRSTKLDELVEDLSGPIRVLELVEVRHSLIFKEGHEHLERSLVRSKSVLGDLPDRHSFGSVLKELLHLVLERNSVTQMDLIREVLGVEFLLTFESHLPIRRLKGSLDLLLGPVRESEDGLIVPPLSIPIDGTHFVLLETRSGGPNTPTIRTTHELHEE
jgi:hypothetical protein